VDQSNKKTSSTVEHNVNGIPFDGVEHDFSSERRSKSKIEMIDPKSQPIFVHIAGLVENGKMKSTVMLIARA
jgi:hypothetical protein